MPVAQRKGAGKKADDLARAIVRSRGVCQFPDCEDTRVVWAHIIVRNWSGTRCLTDNAWALCGKHHALVDAFPDEKMALVLKTIGGERYDELRTIADAYKDMKTTSKLFWIEEVKRLEQEAADLGLDI